MIVDYYQILDVPPESSVAEIHVAYRRAAKRCHPDMGGSQDQMIEVIAGWEVLSDPSKRAVYDAARWSDAATAQASWQAVREQAARTASAVAANQGQTWKQFIEWVEQAASDSNSSSSGRGFAGAVTGSVIAGISGAIIGYCLNLDAIFAAIVGLTAGAIGGFFAGKSRGSN